MGLASWFSGRCQRRQRQIDIEILWPTLCKNAGNTERARLAFAYHAARDPAWADLSDEDRRQIIASLANPLEEYA